jgi:phosphate transport system permease protein
VKIRRTPTIRHRLIGPSLGLTLGQNIAHIILPQAGKGIPGGVILALGRAAEDTAVILLTGVVANSGLPQGLFGKFEALPFTIYFLAAEFRSSQHLLIGFGTVWSFCF